MRSAQWRARPGYSDAGPFAHMMPANKPSRVIDRSSFVGLGPSAQRRFYEEFGFLLVPSVLSAPEVAELLAGLEGHVAYCASATSDGSRRLDYQGLEPRSAQPAPGSSQPETTTLPGQQQQQQQQQHVAGAVAQWPPPEVVALIGRQAVLDPVRRLHGADCKFFKGVAVHSFGRRERQPLHRDFDARGQGGKDWRNSSSDWCNVGIYLANLGEDTGPLWVVPRSRHARILPLRRGAPAITLEGSAADAMCVCPGAGDAVIFHCRTIHAGGGWAPGALPSGRPGCFHSYRSAYAPPAGEVLEWAPEVCAAAPAALQPLLRGLNGGRPLRILQLTDIHLYVPGDSAPINQMRRRFPSQSTLQSVVAQVASEGLAIDRCVLTGDLTQSECASPEGHAVVLGELRRALETQLRCPIRAVPGNHDTRRMLMQAFPYFQHDAEGVGRLPATFNEQSRAPPPTTGSEQPAARAQFVEIVGSWLLIGLDTLDDARARVERGEAAVPDGGAGNGYWHPSQDSWLRSVLARHHELPALIMMHQPPLERIGSGGVWGLGSLFEPASLTAFGAFWAGFCCNALLSSDWVLSCCCYEQRRWWRSTRNKSVAFAAATSMPITAARSQE
eukprot:COSAG01_NODE_123_length_25210_cov_348.799434_20_plen_614_part_00